MADLSKIRSVFDTHLNNYWSKTKIRWDNLGEDLPKGVSWIQPLLIIDDSVNTTLGTMRTRHFGAYTIQVYSPLDIGSGETFDLADELLNIFQNTTFESNILTYAGSIRRIGDNNNGWYQANVILPFTADQP